VGLDHSAFLRTLDHSAILTYHVHLDKTYSSSARQFAGNRIQEYGETNKRWLPLIHRVWVRYVAARWIISICNFGRRIRQNLTNLGSWKTKMNHNTLYFVQPHQPGHRYYPAGRVISAGEGLQRPRLDPVSAEEPSDEPRRIVKPSCSYSCLIGIALLSSPTGCLPVNEIYKSIE